MSSKNEKADAIKSHAINGRFGEIEKEFGSKAAHKGREYASSKLAALRNKVDLGEDITQEKTATAFMMFASKFDVLQDMEEVLRLFTEFTEKAEQSDDLDSPATHQQQTLNGGPQPFENNVPLLLCDAVVELNVSVGDVTDVMNPLLSTPQMVTCAIIDDKDDFTAETDVSKKPNFLLPVSQSAAARKSIFVTPSQDIESACPALKLGKKPFQPVTSKLSVQKFPTPLPMKTVTSDYSKSSKSSKSKNNMVSLSKKVRKEDFPNAPKKPMNAYMIFTEAARRDVLADDPTMKATEVMKELGVRWKLLEDDEKAVYEERANLEKQRYMVKIEEYNEQYPEEAEEYRLSKVKGPQGAAKSKSSKKSKKLTQRDDEESDGIEEIEVDSGMQPHFEEEGNEDIQSSFKSDLTPNSNEADDIEESNIDRRTPNGSLKHVVAVSISHTKKRSNSLSRESRRVPPSRRLQTAAYKLEKTQKSPRKSALSNNKNKTTSTNVTPQPKVLYIDSIAAAAETEKVVSTLKGIKSVHLPPSEDIKRTKTMPRERSPFPADFAPVKGDKVTLILEPYREFVSELAIDLLSPEDLELVQATCLMTQITVSASVISSRSLNKLGRIGEGYENAQILSLKIDGEIYTILYVPFSSPHLRTEIYLLSHKTYTKCFSSSWLIPNAQVRRLFAAGNSGDGEWHEGSIYYIRKDMRENPYSSISVVWMDLERNPRSWFYSYDQMDNLCSPWDLQLSQYVLPENVRAISLPNSLTTADVSAKAVLLYLEGFDFSSVFKYSLTKTKEYIDMYPLKKDQLDLHVIKSRCDQNQYDGKEGLRKLFDDLVQMCSNGKQFNDTNKGFQPWVLVDMMEKTVLDLQPLLLGVCSFTRAPSSSGFKSQMCSQRSRASQDTDPFDDAPDEVVATERGTMQSEFEMEEFTQEV